MCTIAYNLGPKATWPAMVQFQPRNDGHRRHVLPLPAAPLQHPGTGGYYELDSVLVSRSDLRAVNRDLNFCRGGRPPEKERLLVCGVLWVPRKAIEASSLYWRAVRARASQPPPRLHVQDLRGPSPSAVAARARFGCQELLQAQHVSQPPGSTVRNEVDEICEGWEERAPRVWHAYTDGSGERAVVQQGTVLTPAATGWGVQLFARGPKYDACGPVVTECPHALFRGAERCTNNVGEASAILMFLEWAARRLAEFDTLVVHYDSEYAMQLSMGRWKVNRNQALAQRLKLVRRQLSDGKVLKCLVRIVLSCGCTFPTPTMRRKHSYARPAMPYDVWLFRTRFAQKAHDVSQQPTNACNHRGALFWMREARSQHQKTCPTKRLAAGLSLHCKVWHPTENSTYNVPLCSFGL